MAPIELWIVASTTGTFFVDASTSTSVTGMDLQCLITSSIVAVIRCVNCPKEMGLPIVSNIVPRRGRLYSSDPSP